MAAGEGTGRAGRPPLIEYPVHASMFFMIAVVIQ
jgi:hypothetical protein